MRTAKWIVAGLMLFGACGCQAGLKECLSAAAGISTRALEDNLGSALSKEFDRTYPDVYSRTMNILKESKAFIYSQDKAKNLVAIYVSEEDTTPVGIFFREMDKSRTQVLVSSPSHFARDIIAGKIFSGLEK